MQNILYLQKNLMKNELLKIGKMYLQVEYLDFTTKVPYKKEDAQ